VQNSNTNNFTQALNHANELYKIPSHNTFMNFTPGSITKIILPNSIWLELTGHCRRKLQANYLADEVQEIKAFGLIAGKTENRTLSIGAIAPLKKNSRGLCCQKPYMDEIMEKHAIPSETPLDKRGWIADPQELQEKLREFSKSGFQLIGSYHMHRVAWEHDPLRETPTELDEILGESSRMFMFIIAVVNPDRPVIRAFFEGKESLEVPVSICTDHKS